MKIIKTEMRTCLISPRHFAKSHGVLPFLATGGQTNFDLERASHRGSAHAFALQSSMAQVYRM